jgi:Fe2+ transport system protein FeoA
VRESAPLSGPVTIAVGHEQHALPREVAALIGVV